MAATNRDLMPNWEVRESRGEVFETVNAYPSLVVDSKAAFGGVDFEVTVHQTPPAGDDDAMGFVFSYQGSYSLI